MTVTFTRPVSFNTFGIGYTMRISSSYAGARVNPSWLIEILDKVSLTTVGLQQTYPLANGLNQVFVAQAFDTLFLAVPDPLVGQGMQATLRATYTADGAVQDTDTLPITMDWLAGRLTMFAQRMGLSNTPTDLAAILAAVKHTYQNAP